MIWDMLGKGVVQGKPEKALYDTCTYGAITSWEFENLDTTCWYINLNSCLFLHVNILYLIELCCMYLKFYLKFAIIVFIYL